MNPTISVSRDSESLRIELHDKDDVSVLQELGPYNIVQDDNCIVIVQPDLTGAEVLELDQRHWGFRFCDDESIGWTRNANLKYGRFGPIDLEVDIHNQAGFEIVLPPLFERPWPKLRRNKSYDIGEQVMITLAERIINMIDFGEVSDDNAMKAQYHKVPNRLRRHMPYGCGKVMIMEYMARLKLPSVA